MDARTIKLFPASEYVETVQNVAGIRSPMLRITPPAGHYIALRKSIAPVIRLLDSGGNLIAETSTVFVGVERDGQTSPNYAPGAFDLLDHSDLSTTEQRRAENRGPAGTLRKELGRAVMARDENEHIVIEILSDDAIDWTQTGVTFEVEALYGAID